MSDFIHLPISELPERDERHFSEEELVFTPDELERIALYRKQYPTPEGAVMKGLWFAQQKFGWLAPEVIRLVADTLGMSYSQAYGVATFYTQYFKEKKGTYVLDVCTCYACQVCGGYDVLHELEAMLGIHGGETTPDGLFTIQEAECLGACGSAPVIQVTNQHYVHNVTREKAHRLVEDLRSGKLPVFTSVTLPQDQAELGGNRRTDAEALDVYATPRRAEHMG